MSGTPLRIAMFTYRGNPRSGGQGIYMRLLSRELVDMGHKVDVWSGQPYPELMDGVGLEEIPSMDLWTRKKRGFRLPTREEWRDPINRTEYYKTVTGGFPEMLTFSQRVARRFHSNGVKDAYDIIHDNQSLGPGLLELKRYAPVVATIHHPITRDLDIALKSTWSPVKRLGMHRWYSFLPMQMEVARSMDRILTISDAASEDIAHDFKLDRSRMRNVGNGINLATFRPLNGPPADENRIMTTLSADSPLKGFSYLLHAMAELKRKRPALRLTVIGAPGEHTNTARLVRGLDLEDSVHFTGKVEAEDIVQHYSRSALAVVPSLYEGFGFPAGEAMACRVPVISTTAGALPEVVGTDGTTGMLIKPGCSKSLVEAIDGLLDDPDRRRDLAEAGRKRVVDLFSWRRAAERTVDVYREALQERQASSC